VNAVEVRNLHVRYERVEALQGVDFDLPRGTALGIVGPNGSGKSTLLKAVAGLIRPTEGSVLVQGRPPRELPPGTIGYVPQIEDVDWNFPVSVRDVVAMGRFPRASPARSRRSTSARSPTATSVRCPVGSSSAPSSRGRSPRSRSCCCSTSRRPASTRPPKTHSCISCAASFATGCRSS